MIFKTTDDGGLTNIFKELKSVQVTFEELDKTTLRSAIKSFNNTSISVEDLSKKFGGLDNSVVEYLNNTERGQASMDGLSKSIDNSATSMISATAKAKILAIALNALTGLAISLAFKGITWAIDELIVTLDEQKEKLDEAVTVYEESKSELEKINDELKTTSERIDELNGKENLTFTEQDELEKLIKTNDELERKIYLLEQANKEAEKEVATEAQNTYDKYTNNRTLGAVEQIEFYSDSSLLEGVNWDNFKGDLSWLVAQYKNQEEILANAQVNGWTNIEEQAKSNLELLEGYMSEASLDYQDLYDKIGGISDFAMTEDLELAKQDLDDILDIVAEILGYGGQRSETSFDDIWNSEDFSQYKTELETLAKEGKLNASVLESNEQYKKLLEDTGATAESTAEHINALVAEMEQTGTQNPDEITDSWAGKFKSLWDSESFSDAKKSLQDLSKESEVTADDVKSLAEENEELATLLEESGMSAQFASKCFTEMCRNGNGFSAITNDALLLDQVLHGMDDSLQKVKKSKSEYDKAMSGDDYNTDFKNYQEAYASAMEMFENGDYGKQFRATMEYILGEDSFTMSIDEMHEAVSKLGTVFGESADDGYEFLDKLYANKDILDELDSSLVKLSDGSYEFDLKPEEFEAIADALGMTEEGVTACVNALGMFGNYSSYNLDELELAMNSISIAAKDGEKSITSLQGVKNILENLGYSGYDVYHILGQIQEMGSIELIDFETSNIDDTLSKLQKIQDIKIDGNQIDLDSLITGMKNLGNSGTDIANFIDRLNGTFTLTDITGQIISLEDAKNRALSVDTNEVNESMAQLGESSETTAQKVSTVNSEIDNLNKKLLNSVRLQFVNLSTASDVAKQNIQKIIDRINILNGMKINVDNKTNVNPEVPESKGYRGTVGKAFANGTFDKIRNLPITGYDGLQKDERNALRSEYGQPELTVYPNGVTELTTQPTMSDLPKGTVIFNEEQTKKIIENGNKKVGKAFANGTIKKKKLTINDSASIKKDSSVDSTKEATKETFNFIETALSRIQRNITNLGKTVSATYKQWSTRNNALAQEMQAVNQEIATQQSAYNAYMSKANGIPLAESYKELVRNGAMSIQDITDDTLKEQISTYTEWYEKALECSDAVQDLQDQLADLAMTKFDNISKQFDDQISLITHHTDMLDGYVSRAEASGFWASEVYYQKMLSKEQEKVIQLQTEYNDLNSQFNENVNNGLIEKYSEQWYEMYSAINDVESALQEANTALVEYQQTLQQIRWDVFDRGADYKNNLVDEANFLIDMLDNYDLHNNNGTLTNQGMSVQGLHAMNYNVYMEESEKYLEEIQKINKEIAKDPYDLELIDRRNALIELQQESITNAMSEKDAILDLAKNGYDKMSESLDELINKRKEALNAERDLFNYQNTIKEKTDTISNYKKQLQAYSGDNSEEAKATIQKIELSLKDAEQDLTETEYDKWLSDQESMLDTLANETEEWINGRLDQIDGLIYEAIMATNTNASIINNTLHETTDALGYTLSSTMSDIWNAKDDVVKTYGDILYESQNIINTSINSGVTTVQSALKSIDDDLLKMIEVLNAEAKAQAESIAKTQQQSTASQNNNSHSAPAPSAPAQNSNSSSKPTSNTIVFTGGTFYEDSYKGGSTGNSRNQWTGHEVEITHESSTGMVHMVDKTTGTVLGWVDKKQLKGYYTGTNNAKKGIAEVSEKGDEIILTKDGEVLLAKGNQLFPFEGGETVFNAAKTAELLSGDLVPLNQQMFMPNLVKTPNLPDFSKMGMRNHNNNVNNDIQLNIAVKADNFDEFCSSFKTAIKTDPQCRKLLQSVTIDETVGKGGLSRNKY